MKTSLLAAALLLGARAAVFANCAVPVFITNTPGAIQNAVNAAAPGPLPSDYCIFLSTGVYNENVTIQGIATGGFRIILSTYAAPSGAVIVSPVTGGAAFTIQNDSVTLNGMTIIPGAAGIGYGLVASSNDIIVSSMDFTEGAFAYSNAAVLLNPTAGNGALSYSSMTVGADVDMQIDGSVDSVSYSTMTSNSALAALQIAGAAGVALSNSYVSNASVGGGIAVSAGASGITIQKSTAISAGNALSVDTSNGITVNHGFFASSTGYGLSLTGGSSFGSFSLSTFSASAAGFDGAALISASSNTFTQCYAQGLSATSAGLGIYTGSNNVYTGGTIVSLAGAGNASAQLFGPSVYLNTLSNTFVFNGVGTAALLNGGASFNSITGDTITGNVASAATGALYFSNSSYNTLTYTFVTNGAGNGLFFDAGSDYNLVINSTMSSAGGEALFINNSSTETLTFDLMQNSGGPALDIDATGSYNSVSQSTMQALGAGPALFLNGGGYNSFTQDYIFNSAGLGSAAYIVNAASQNVISLSTMTTNAAGFPAVLMSGVTTNTITQSLVSNASGDGLQLAASSYFNVVSLSTMSSNAAAHNALYVKNSSFNVITTDYVLNPHGNAAFLDVGANLNLISTCTLFSDVSTSSGLAMAQASSNTIQHDQIANSLGNAAGLSAGSDYNQIRLSTLTSAGAGSAALELTNSSWNVITQSVLNNLGGGAGANLYGSGQNAFTKDALNANTGGAPALGLQLFSASNTITQCQLNNSAGAGLFSNTGSSTTITASLIAGTTGALLQGDGGMTIIGSTLTSTAGTDAAVGLIGGSVNLMLNADVLTSLSAGGAALSVNAPGPVVALSALTMRGNLVLLSGTFQAGSFNHLLGGNLVIAAPGDFTAQGSTITFDGSNDLPARTFQSATLPLGLPNASFNGLAVNVSSLQFTNAFNAAVFTDDFAGSTVTFEEAGPFSAINDLEIHGTGPPNGFINLRSIVPGTPWPLDLVAISSVNSARVSDSNASGGNLVEANDLTSVDAGGNTNWNFLPFLAASAQGQVYTSGVGNVGAPFVEKAGVSFAISIYAVSSSSHVLAAANFPVTMTSSDPFGTPSTSTFLTQSLVNGATIFNVIAKVAEPSPVLDAFTVAAILPLSSYGPTSSTVTVTPNNYAAVQVLMPGEISVPGSATGKAQLPDVQVSGRPIPTVTLRAVDKYFNVETAIVDLVSILGVNAASATWPAAAQPFAAGVKVFASTVTVYSTGTFLLAAQDTAPGIALGVSSPFLVVFPSLSSPTVNINIAGSTVATLSGGLTGGAGDPESVNKVLVAIESAASQLYYSPWIPLPPGGTFASAVPVYGTATLSAHGAPSTQWDIQLPDAALTAGTSYFVTAVAIDASGLIGTTTGVFTYLPLSQALGAGGGLGSAFAVPAISSGCEPIIATVTFTVGAAGLQPGGGGVALHVPAGWTLPLGGGPLEPNPPPVGYVVVTSTSAAMSTAVVGVNTSTFGSAGQSLGGGWITVAPKAAPFNPGENILFTYAAQPPPGAIGRGPQVFTVLSQSISGGALAAVNPPPVVTLGPGTTNFLSFGDYTALNLAPLQYSPTIQLSLTDACGNLASTNTVAVAALTAIVNTLAGPQGDATAVFYSTGIGGAPITQVDFPPNQSLSQPFYYQTSTTGVGMETVVAAGAIPSRFGSFNSLASRTVLLQSSSATLLGVSIDTGTLSPGQTTATVVYGYPTTSVYVRFTSNYSNIPWETVISTDPVNFSSPTYRATGLTDTSHPVALAWNGLDSLLSPPQFVAPGVYYVRIRLAGGVAQSTALQVQIPQSPFIMGNLGARGAGAYVAASGLGTVSGNDTVATATGYFQVFGLVDQSSYNVTVTTIIAVAGQSVNLSTTAFNIMAADGGNLIPGTLALPPTSFMRVSVILPTPAPHDTAGSVSVHNANYTVTAAGSLHFFAGYASSDSGASAFGQPPSTWTYIGLPPGTYTLDVSVPDLTLSAEVPNISLPANLVVDEPVSLVKKTNVYGYALLPSTSPFPVTVSIQALEQGAAQPSVFTQAVVNAFSVGNLTSSAPYSLFGLNPGTWTLTAQAAGYASTQTLVVISTSGVDIGDPTFLSPGFSLQLGAGGLIVGTVTVNGSTLGSSPPSGLCPAADFLVTLQAYNVQTTAAGAQPLCLPRSAASSVSTYTIAGLNSGNYALSALLPGFFLSPAGGSLVSVSTPAVSVASFTLVADNTDLSLNIAIPPLPGGVCHSTNDYQAVGLSMPGPVVTSNITTLTPIVVNAYTDADAAGLKIEQFFCSSMTLTLPLQIAGFQGFEAWYAPTGAASIQTLPLTAGTTTGVSLNLAVATFTVSGQVSFSGAVSLPLPGGLSVNVSSIPGITANAAGVSYCLVSSSSPVAVSAFHMELVPLNPAAGGPAPPLCVPTGGCAIPVCASGTAGTLGYAAVIGRDGSFSFSGVPAGDYILRNDPNVDGNPLDGPQMSQFQTQVHVAGNTSGLALPLAQGVPVQGSLFTPGGLPVNRQVAVSLEDSQGNVIETALANFANANSASYQFTNVGNGPFSVVTRDLTCPPALAARPLLISVAGQPLSGQNLTMQPGGTLKATIGLQQSAPSGASQMIVIGSQNQTLLPQGFSADAIANPWFLGGLFYANGYQGGGQGASCAAAASTLDSNGQVVIQDVLPGSYNVEFNVPGGGSASGGLGLVSAVKAGVSVGPGQTLDLGVVSLLTGSALAGTVTDMTTRSPVANVLMMAKPSVALPGQVSGRSGYPTTYTDQSGRYLFTGLDPTVRFYDIFAAGRLGMYQGDTVPPYEQAIVQSVDIQSTTTLNFALSPAPYSVSGQILGRGGALLNSGFGQSAGSLPGAAIYLQRANVVPVANPLADTVFFTDEQGNFTIPSVAAGTYRMVVEALGYQNANLVVTVGPSVNLGQVQMNFGATLQGAIRQPDGSAASADEIGYVVGVTPSMSDFFFGALTLDPVTHAVTGYQLSGFRSNQVYRLLFLSADGQQVASPPEAANLVFTSSLQVQNLDVVYTPPPPFVVAKDLAAGGGFNLIFQFSQPLRGITPNDNELSIILTTVSAQGAISGAALENNRQTLVAAYIPAVNESSFTLHVKAYTSIVNPASLDPVNPQYVVDSTVSFFVGINGAHRAYINNAAGGVLQIEGDQGRVSVPKGAFGVDASSAVTVLLQKFNLNTPTGGQQNTLSAARAEANLKTLAYAPSAYPASIIQAVAALPPSVTPQSGFYDILLPAGVPTALSRPTPLTVAYSTGTDPATLNLYWYNAAANAYILQQDVTGASPVIDAVNHTLTVNVNHFSTFVLFDSALGVLSGTAFPGDDIEAFNFPNPFDLSVKTVSAIHGGSCEPNCTIKGTMIRFSLPLSITGDATIRIFDVAGERVRTISMGTLPGGAYYYQNWDGTNDSGRAVASGVYIGEVTVAGNSKFFKMALIK